jgi:hypothetical protein
VKRSNAALICSALFLGSLRTALAAQPDWSGIWIIPLTDFTRAISRESNPDDPIAPRLTPRYLATLEAFNVHELTGQDPAGVAPVRSNSELCLPEGMPDVMRFPAAIEFLFTRGRVTLLSEDAPSIRRIYTDGRQHAADADPTYLGDSIGHWEGNMLIVDTSNIRADAQLLPGVRSSGKAHVVERIHRKDATHLQIDTVVDDPLALRSTWRYTRIYERVQTPFSEYVCLDHDRDAQGGEPDLTPPR